VCGRPPSAAKQRPNSGPEFNDLKPKDTYARSHNSQLNAIEAEEGRLRTVLGEYQAALGNVLKDLGNYAVAIDQPPEQAPDSFLLGNIIDPKSVFPTDAVATKLLGRTVSFSVFEVNQVAAFVSSGFSGTMSWPPTQARRASSRRVSTYFGGHSLANPGF
jgi:hypothetical protein